MHCCCAGKSKNPTNTFTVTLMGSREDREKHRAKQTTASRRFVFEAKKQNAARQKPGRIRTLVAYLVALLNCKSICVPLSSFTVLVAELMIEP